MRRRAAVSPLLTFCPNVGELGTDHEVAVNSVTTTADDVAITVGADVFDRITAALDRATESDSCHCFIGISDDIAKALVAVGARTKVKCGICSSSVTLDL